MRVVVAPGLAVMIGLAVMLNLAARRAFASLPFVPFFVVPIHPVIPFPIPPLIVEPGEVRVWRNDNRGRANDGRGNADGHRRIAARIHLPRVVVVIHPVLLRRPVPPGAIVVAIAPFVRPVLLPAERSEEHTS